MATDRLRAAAERQQHYRITVRSAPPDTIGNRSVVVLQAMVKIGS